MKDWKWSLRYGAEGLMQFSCKNLGETNFRLSSESSFTSSSLLPELSSKAF